MPKLSQRKGRAGEHEAAKALNKLGFSAVVKGIYEPYDLAVDFGEGKERLVEVKRKKNGMGPVYLALRKGNDVFMHRSDDERWLICFDLETYAEMHTTITPADGDWMEAMEKAIYGTEE